MNTVKRTPTIKNSDPLSLHYSKEILLNFNLMSSRFHFYHKDEFYGSYFKIHLPFSNVFIIYTIKARVNMNYNQR